MNRNICTGCESNNNQDTTSKRGRRRRVSCGEHANQEQARRPSQKRREERAARRRFADAKRRGEKYSRRWDDDVASPTRTHREPSRTRISRLTADDADNNPNGRGREAAAAAAMAHTCTHAAHQQRQLKRSAQNTRPTLRVLPLGPSARAADVRCEDFFFFCGPRRQRPLGPRVSKRVSPRMRGL
ncbi:hypothetical protein ISCGN_010842 [Ixodes scapularis]